MVDVERDNLIAQKTGDSDSGLGFMQPGTWPSTSALRSSIGSWLPLYLHDLGTASKDLPQFEGSRSFHADGGGDVAYAAGSLDGFTPRLHHGSQARGLIKQANTPLVPAGSNPNLMTGVSSGSSVSSKDRAIMDLSDHYAQAGLKEALADSEQRRGILLEKLKEAQDTLRIQSARLAKVETAYHNSTFEVEELKHKEIKMKSKLGELEQQCREQLQQRSDEVSVQAALHNRIHEMESGFQKFISDYQLLEVDHGRRRELVDQLTTTIELVEDENRKLHKSLGDLTNDGRQLQQENAVLKEERKSLQAQAESTKHDIAHWRQECEENQRGQRSAEEALSELRIKMATLNHKLETMDSNYEALQKDKQSGQYREREMAEVLTDLKSKVAILSSDKERLIQEKVDMQHKLEHTTMAKTGAEKSLYVTNEQLSSTTSELRAKQELLRDLDERHHKIVEEQLASQKVAEKLSIELTRTKDMCEQEQEEKQTLKRMNMRLTDDNACLEESVNKLKRENMTCKGETECLQAAYLQEKQRSDEAVDKLQASVKKLQKENAEFCEVNAGLVTRLKQLDVDVMRQVSDLNSDIQQWKARYESAQASMQRKEDEVSMMAHKVKELELETSRLGAELHTKQMEIDNSTHAQEEVHRLQLANKRLHQEKAENEQVVQLLQTQRDIYARSVNEHAARAREVQLKADSMKLLEEDSYKNKIKADELQKQLHILLGQKEELLLKLTAADQTSVKHQEELGLLRQAQIDSGRRLQQLEVENSSITVDLSSCKQSSLMTEKLIAEKSAFLEEHGKLLADLKTYQGAEASHILEMSMLKADLETLRSEKKVTESNCAILQQTVKAHESASYLALQEVTVMKASASGFEAERAELSNRCQRLSSELQATRHELTDRLESLQTVLANSQQESAAWSTECQRLQTEIAEKYELKQKVSAAERCMSRMEAELASANEQASRAQEQAIKERRVHADEVAQLRVTLSGIESERNALKGHCERLQGDVFTKNELASKLVVFDEECSRLRIELDDMRHLEESLSLLQSQCDQQQADLSSQADIRKELLLVKEHCERLQADLSESGEVSEKELALLRSDQIQLLRGNEALSQRAQELEVVAAEKHGLWEELQRCKNHVAELEHQLKHSGEKCSSLESDLTLTKAKQEEIAEDKAQLRVTAEKLLQEKTALLLEKSALQQERATLADRSSSLELMLLTKADAENKVNVLKGHIVILDNQRRLADTEVERLREELASLRRDNAMPREQLTNFKDSTPFDRQSDTLHLREELEQSHDIQIKQEDLIGTLQEEISLLRKYEQESRELRDKLNVITWRAGTHSAEPTPRLTAQHEAREFTQLINVKDRELEALQKAVQAANAEIGRRDEKIQELGLRLSQLQSSASRKEIDQSTDEKPSSCMVKSEPGGSKVNLHATESRQPVQLSPLMDGSVSIQAWVESEDILVLRHQLGKLSNELNILLVAKKAMQRQLTELKMDVFKLQKDKETLERTNARVQGTLTDSQELLRAMTLELDTTKSRCAAAESQCDKYRSENLNHQKDLLETRSIRKLDSLITLKAESNPADCKLPLSSRVADNIDHEVLGDRESKEQCPRTSSAMPGPQVISSDHDSHARDRPLLKLPQEGSQGFNATSASPGSALTRDQTLRIFKQLKKNKRGGTGSRKPASGAPRLVVSEAYALGGDAGQRRRDSFEMAAEGSDSDSSEVEETELKDAIVSNSGRVEWRGDPRASIKKYNSSYDLSSISDEDDNGSCEGSIGDRATSMPNLAQCSQSEAPGSKVNMTWPTNEDTVQETSYPDYARSDTSEEYSPRIGSANAAQRTPRSDWRQKFADVYRQVESSLT